MAFFTTDIDPDVHRAAREITRGARLMSGAQFLQHLHGKISVAYMDGFDWIPHGSEHLKWIWDHRARYAELGVELSNENCQAEHLREAVLIAKKSTDRCRVILDDTWRERGAWNGKGGTAVPFLQSVGFSVVKHGRRGKRSLGYVVMQRG